MKSQAAARPPMIESVDTLGMVHRISRRPSPEELIERGFQSAPGTIPSSITWFHRGSRAKYTPRLFFYELWGGGFGLRADVSLPKFIYGNNISLPSTRELNEALERISHWITREIRLSFDAFTASTCRIDYATNYETVRKNTGAFFDRYQRFWIPRLKFRPDLSRATSAYYGNASRMIRMYDKLFQERGPDESSETNSASDISLIRIEYMLASEPSVVNFAKRLGFPDTKVQTMISDESRKAAITEMSRLLQLETFDPEADFSFSYFLKQTKNISRAQRLSSFVSAFQLLGPHFHRQKTARMSDATYVRQLRECQKYGF